MKSFLFLLPFFILIFIYPKLISLLGPAVLAWSFNHEGEAKPEMILQNEKFMSSINRKKKRDKRAHLEKIAHPQQGINDLTAKFHRTSENAKINPFDRVEESGTKSVEHVQESIQ